MDQRDIDRCWTQSTSEQRQLVQDLADELGAEVALAAGTGRLDEYEGVRGYELWKLLASGEWTFPEMWVARIKAAPTRRAAVRTAIKLLVPNPHRMETELERAPNLFELALAYVQRAWWGVGELGRFLFVRIRRSRGTK